MLILALPLKYYLHTVSHRPKGGTYTFITVFRVLTRVFDVKVPFSSWKIVLRGQWRDRLMVVVLRLCSHMESKLNFAWFSVQCNTCTERQLLLEKCCSDGKSGTLVLLDFMLAVTQKRG